MESVPFTFLIFYPNIFQHKLSISSTNFFILYLNILHSLLLSETRGMCDKCSALLVKHQWLNPSVFISCKKKKEIIPSSVKSWHTWSRPFPNYHATTSRTDTKLFFFFSASSVVLPPGICFRGNINHSGKGECLPGKHLGENCSMASLSWLGTALPIKFSTRETPHGNCLTSLF